MHLIDPDEVPTNFTGRLRVVDKEGILIRSEKFNKGGGSPVQSPDSAPGKACSQRGTFTASQEKHDWFDIRVEVKHRIKTLRPAGLLLAPAYDIDYAPFDNIVAFVEAVEEFGRI